VISFGKAFHGRTSLAVEATDNPKIIAPINANGHITYLPLNDIEAAKAELAKEDIVLSSLKVYRELAVSKYRLPNSCKSSAKPVQNTEQS